MLKPLISVIIPVYNVQPYIRKCLDSVIKQTYKNLEIILIDDGSTDGSGDICAEYAKLDKRIIVKHQKNAGLSTARNVGIDLCRGAYLMFVDSDDYLDLGIVQTLFDNLCHYEADMVSGYTKRVALCKHDGHRDSKFSQTIICDDPEKLLMGLYIGELPHEVVGKIFKRQLFASKRFLDYKISEDLLLWLDLYGEIKKAVFLPIRQYYYVVRENSRMSFNKFSANIFDDLLVMKHLRDVMPQFSKSLGQVGERRYFYSVIHILQKFVKYEVTERYATVSNQYHQEVRQDIFKLLINPFINLKMKLSLFLVSMDVKLFYKTYILFLKVRSSITQYLH